MVTGVGEAGEKNHQLLQCAVAPRRSEVLRLGVFVPGLSDVAIGGEQGRWRRGIRCRKRGRARMALIGEADLIDAVNVADGIAVVVAGPWRAWPAPAVAARLRAELEHLPLEVVGFVSVEILGLRRNRDDRGHANEQADAEHTFEDSLPRADTGSSGVDGSVSAIRTCEFYLRSALYSSYGTEDDVQVEWSRRDMPWVHVLLM